MISCENCAQLVNFAKLLLDWVMILVQLMLWLLIDVVVDESLLGYAYSWIEDENLNGCWCFGENDELVQLSSVFKFDCVFVSLFSHIDL